MTEDRLPLAELLQKAGDGDFLRAVAEAVLQILMESDVEGLIGASRPVAGGLAHHSDRGIQGGFDRSSQHRRCGRLR
jgi:hypothetical protein